MYLPDLSKDGAERRAAREVERRAGRPARGKEAEAEFVEECKILQAQRRLFWLRLPDPLVPAPKARKVRGMIACIPHERERGTDFVGAALPAGRMTGIEVKSFYTAKKDGAAWSHAELRNAQINALEGMASDGLPAYVWLVHYTPRGATRYLLPWRAGVGLPGAEVKSTALDKSAEPYRQRAGETWLDVAQRLEDGGASATLALNVTIHRATGDAVDDELHLHLGARRVVRIAPAERLIQVADTKIPLSFRPHPEWRRCALAFAGAALHAELEPHAARVVGTALADHKSVAMWLRFECDQL